MYPFFFLNLSYSLLPVHNHATTRSIRVCPASPYRPPPRPTRRLTPTTPRSHLSLASSPYRSPLSLVSRPPPTPPFPLAPSPSPPSSPSAPTFGGLRPSDITVFVDCRSRLDPPIPSATPKLFHYSDVRPNYVAVGSSPPPRQASSTRRTTRAGTTRRCVHLPKNWVSSHLPHSPAISLGHSINIVIKVSPIASASFTTLSCMLTCRSLFSRASLFASLCCPRLRRPGHHRHRPGHHCRRCPCFSHTTSLGDEALCPSGSLLCTHG